MKISDIKNNQKFKTFSGVVFQKRLEPRRGARKEFYYVIKLDTNKKYTVKEFETLILFSYD